MKSIKILLWFLISLVATRNAYAYKHMSPYAYCAGDPINNIDPTGMSVVADSTTQVAMTNSFPEAERQLLHFDKNGLLTVDQAESPSEILANIQNYEDEGVWGFELKRVDNNKQLELQINKIQKIIRKNYYDHK